MARVPEETIELIRNTADIYDVVVQYVDLKKRGKNFFGLCPFHSEKTPSFCVSPDKQIYNCFSCPAGGNVFSFIMDHEKISFIEAVQQLGQKYGIEVARQSGPSNKIFSSLYEMHDIAVKLYHNILFSEKGKAALDYLHNRGLTDDTIKTYQIGFAPDSWDTLTNKIKSSSSFKDDVYEKSGLFNKNSRGSRYDRFRSRIMFPIYHPSGKAIAFGGRKFNCDDPGNAKYLNSPETPLYRKRETFYGLHKTRDSIRMKKEAVLVEGYTDFLQLIQIGVTEVVALCGTALGVNQVNQIGKFASKVYLAYDGDGTGKEHAIKAGYLLFQAGIEPLVIPVPNGKDPDDWVREEGKSAFQEAMGSRMSLLLFHLQYEVEKAKVEDVKNLSATDRSRIVKEILNEISLINDGIIRDGLLKSLSQELQLDEVEVFRLFNSQTWMKRVRADSEQSNTKDQPFTSTMQKAQLEIIRAIAYNFDEVYPSMKNIIDFQIFDEPILQKIGLLLIEDKKPTAIIDEFENMHDKKLVSQILFDEVSFDDPQLIIKECFSTIKKKIIKDQIKQARIKIRELESSGKDTKDIIIQVTELQKSLQELTENIETD